MKVLISIILITLANFTFANPNSIISINAKYNHLNGDLIPPDRILLVRGLKAYQKGYYKSSLTSLKKAAAFGNSEAQKYIGLMHIKSLGVNQSWAKGYAWIKLAALDGTQSKKELETKILSKLKPQEIKQSIKEYSEIIKDYGTSATNARRYRWFQKQKVKVLGSRAGAQTASVEQVKIVNNGRYSSLNNLNGKTTSGLSEMNRFMYEYNFGLAKPAKKIVTPKEIKTVD